MVSCRLLDLGAVTILLALASVPLLVLRGSPLLGQPEVLAILFALPVGLVVLWSVLARRFPESPPSDVLPSPEETSGALPWWRTALVAVLLGVLTLVCFYYPLRIHFWGGADDFINFLPSPHSSGFSTPTTSTAAR